MIDVVTYDRFQKAQALAKRRGLSLAEVLDVHHLLLTKERKAAVEQHVLFEVGRRLELQTAPKLMAFEFQRNSGTAQEMLTAVTHWYEILNQQWIDGELEDL